MSQEELARAQAAAEFHQGRVLYLKQKVDSQKPKEEESESSFDLSSILPAIGMIISLIPKLGSISNSYTQCKSASSSSSGIFFGVFGSLAVIILIGLKFSFEVAVVMFVLLSVALTVLIYYEYFVECKDYSKANKKDATNWFWGAVVTDIIGYSATAYFVYHNFFGGKGDESDESSTNAPGDDAAPAPAAQAEA